MKNFNETNIENFFAPATTVINIRKETNVSASTYDSSRRSNAKSIYCITTGEIFASSTDTALRFSVAQATVSHALKNGVGTVRGYRLCWLSRIEEHIEEIAEARREQSNIVHNLQYNVNDLIEMSRIQTEIEIRRDTARKLKELYRAEEAMIADLEDRICDLKCKLGL